MTKKELEMRKLVRESDVIDRTDGSELAKAFNYLWEKYVEQEPCEDAIRREDALMCLTGEIKETDTIETIIARSGRRIRKLPSVKPQDPKTGHWRAVYQGDELINYRCSECEFGNTFGKHPYGMYYCPNCGAKMF